VAEKVHLPTSVGSNPAGKISAIVAGMVAGGDSIDDLGVIRHGGMRSMFAGVYAPSTLGSFLREFTHGHVRQLQSAGREALVQLASRTAVLAGADQVMFVDVDSMLRRCYGKKKQGVAFGHAKVGGYDVRLRGYNPLIATLSTLHAAPVVAATRLRAGNAGSARGAASMVAEAIGTAKACGAGGLILMRADSAFYTKKVIWACRRSGARFSVTTRIDAKIRAACQSITADQWIDIKYPEAVWDDDEQRWISDAQIAEIVYTAFEGTRHAITARLIVRRVKRLDPDAHTGQGELFPQHRYFAVFTDSPFVLEQAEAQHRGHAIIEQINADLIDGPLAHGPLRRQQRMVGLRRHRPQPDPRRRAPGRTPLRQGAGRDHSPRNHQRRRPTGPPRPRHPPAPTRTLALAERLHPSVHRGPRPTRLIIHIGQSLAVDGRPHPRNPANPPEQADVRGRQIRHTQDHDPNSEFKDRLSRKSGRWIEAKHLEKLALFFRIKNGARGSVEGVGA
jgi:hypothetical protein